MSVDNAISVLLVDDAKVVRQICKNLFEDLPVNVKVAEAETAREAGKMLMRQRFDIVFLDIYIPEITGLELLDSITFDGPPPYIVIMSSQGELELKEQARLLGANDYLTKPFTGAQVSTVFETWQKTRKIYSVLLVDDARPIRKLVAKLLNDTGFRMSITEAESGFEALDLLKANKFDIIFLDINMPGIDGIETLRHIRNRDKAARVVMISGHGTNDYVTAARMIGINGFLVKPFSPHDVVKVIKGLFSIAATELEKLEK